MALVSTVFTTPLRYRPKFRALLASTLVVLRFTTFNADLLDFYFGVFSPCVLSKCYISRPCVQKWNVRHLVKLTPYNNCVQHHSIGIHGYQAQHLALGLQQHNSTMLPVQLASLQAVAGGVTLPASLFHPHTHVVPGPGWHSDIKLTMFCSHFYICFIAWCHVRHEASAV